MVKVEADQAAKNALVKFFTAICVAAAAHYKELLAASKKVIKEGEQIEEILKNELVDELIKDFVYLSDNEALNKNIYIQLED